MAREYKDSGIEWIGQIPKEWEVSKLKYLTTLLQSGGTPTSSNASLYCEDGTSWVAIGDMRHCGEISYTQKHLTDEGLKEKSLIVFPVGTLLYSIYASVGKVSILGIPAAINQAILAISLNEKAKQEYVKFVLTSMENYVFSLANGNTQFNLNAGIVSNFVLPLPSLLSQQKIADYLDKVCGEVDEMVTLQETMVEELKAYKQSVITEAVTKGLDPNVPMRNSGIDWIGEIPEGWKVCRIKNVASLFGRIGFRGYTSDDLNKDGIGAITLSPSNMKPMGMDYQHVTFLSWKKYEESPEIMIQNEDLLMVKTGSSYGKVSYVSNLPREATINPQILRIVPSILSKYLGYYMQTPLFLYQVEGGVVGGTIPTISQEKINNFYVVLPKGNEQRAIASYLDTKCSEIDALIALKQAKIEELKEYKKSVIYEYVTGKKEVE